jgi:hypothetical protein
MSRNLGALTLLDSSGPAWPVIGVLHPYLYLFMPKGVDLESVWFLPVDVSLIA